MRRTLLAVFVLLALGGAAWLVVKGLETPDADPAGEVERGRVPAPYRTEPDAPTLAPAAGASTIPLEMRGESAIVGRVLRAGEATRASVSLHLGEKLAASDPLGVWRGRSFVDRIVDVGIAQGAAIATVQTGTDGRFAFPGISPGVYEVRAHADDDGARGRAQAAVPAAGARVETTVELPTGGETLRGRVVAKDGATFRGWVMVEAAGRSVSMLWANPDAALTQVDTEGRFRLGGLPAGQVVVSAVQPGAFRVIAPPITLPHAGEYVLRVGGGEVEVQGRVVDAQSESPVAGAVVTAGAGDPRAGLALIRTTSDAEGGFTLRLPGGVDGGLFVTAEDYAPLSSQWRDEPESELELRLLKTARLTGRVVPKDGGEGPAGVWVFGMPPSRGPSLAFPVAARTRAGGHFELPGVAPGVVTVFALGSGWVSPDVARVDGEGYNPLGHDLEPGATEEVELEVERSGELVGNVRTGSGEAVRGAVVQGVSELPVLRDIFRLAVFGGGVATFVTDADGAFEIDTLVPGAEYHVDVRAVGHGPCRSGPVTAASGEQARLDVVLADARWLTLEVVSSEGGPVAGARVAAATREGDGRWRELPIRAKTDAEGKARLGPLPDGGAGVQANADGYVDVRKWEEVIGLGEGTEHEATITLEKGVDLAGRVVAPEGAPMQRVRIRVQSADRHAGSSRVSERPAVGADGTWRVTGVRAQPLKVTAGLTWQGVRYHAEAKVEAGREDVELKLEPVEEQAARELLVVRVLDPKGRPVPRGQVVLRTRGETGSGHSSRSFRDGRAEFSSTNLVPEDRQAWVEVFAVPGGLWGSKVVGPLAPGVRDVEVRLEPAVTVAGVVVGPDGEGVRGVRVIADPDLGDGKPSREEGHSDTVTAEDGGFELGGLGASDYLLRVAAPPAFAPVDPVHVRGGQRGVRIELATGLSGRVTVVDGEGKRVPEARVSAQPFPASAGPGANLRTDGDGVAEVSGLAPDLIYRVTVTPPHDRHDLLPAPPLDWSGGDVTFRLERAYAITGRVLDMEGRPVESATVYHATDAGLAGWQGTRCAADGAFRITGLERGSAQLYVAVGNANPWGPGRAPEITTVQAGDEGVTLRVDPGATLRVRIRGWGEDDRAFARLQGEGEGNPFVTALNVEEGGRVVFLGLDANRTYLLWARAADESHYALGTGLRPGDQEIVVEWKEGETITGRILDLDLEGRRSRNVAVSLHGTHAGGRIEDDGTFVIRGLPPGTWPVTATVFEEGGSWTGTGEAATGSSLELKLEYREHPPRPPRR